MGKGGLFLLYDLSSNYVKCFNEGSVKRPYIIFDLTDPESIGYDLLKAVKQSGENGPMDHISDLGHAFFPDNPNDNQPFWRKLERNFFMAALLYYLPYNLGFSSTLLAILSRPASSLCKEMLKSDDPRIKILLGEIGSLKDETIASIDAGVRSELANIANDVSISHAFRGEAEGAKCFQWSDVEDHIIFLRIPENKIEDWGNVINVMYSQLIRYLEQRPEKHTPEAAKVPQILLLMDEFARFGKIARLPSAMATLRSKKVNICLMVQSVAQLDAIYGSDNRKIMFDNCQYQAILQANDADTQKLLSVRIGTFLGAQRSMSKHRDKKGKVKGFSGQVSELRQPIIRPESLSTLPKIGKNGVVLLLSPYGFYVLEKITPTGDFSWHTPSNPSEEFQNARNMTKAANSQYVPLRNEGAKMMSIEHRGKNAEETILSSKQQKRKTSADQKRLDQRRDFIMGEYITTYFPEVKSIVPGKKEENATRFAQFEAFLYVLSEDRMLMEDLKKRAENLVEYDPEGSWRKSTRGETGTPDSDDVHLHIEEDLP